MYLKRKFESKMILSIEKPLNFTLYTIPVVQGVAHFTKSKSLNAICMVVWSWEKVKEDS